MTHRSDLALAALLALLLPTLASAIFPPIYNTPTTPATQIVQQQGQPEEPRANIVGIPEAPDIKDPPEAKTPEPATIITGLMGLAMAGGYLLRRRKKEGEAVA